MNLKPFVASMFILGLASSAAVAAPADAQAQLDAMKSRVASMERIIYTNQAGGFQQPTAGNSWFNRITFSGMANIDSAWANRNPLFYSSTTTGAPFSPDKTSTDIRLNNANLFVDADVNEWTKVHLGFKYQDTSSFRDRVGTRNDMDSIVDEAYVRLGNLEKTPVYAVIGKQYVAFGDYERFPMTKSLTQLMTETHGTAATLGYIDAGSGFNAAAYLLRGAQRVSNTTGAAATTLVQNFGLNLGIANTNDRLGYKLSVGYLANMADVDYINRLTGPLGSFNTAGYTKAVGGLSVDGKIAVGAFDANAHYVTALQDSNLNDMSFRTSSTTVGTAKPAAWALEAGYSFKTMAHDSRLSLGYQGTRQAGGFASTTTGGSLLLPQRRWIGSYKVNVSKNADVGVELYNDRDYGVGNGGTDKSVTVGVLRLGVKFS